MVERNEVDDALGIYASEDEAARERYVEAALVVERYEFSVVANDEVET